MSKIIALNPKRHIFNLIGTIAKEPSLLKRPDIELEKNDAVDDVPKILIASIVNIVKNGGYSDPITVVDVDNYVSKFSKIYEIYKSGEGNKWLDDSIKNAKASMFDYDYSTIKKYSYLRKYHDSGFDIRDIYNYETTDVDEEQKSVQTVEDMSVTDIIDHFTSKASEIKRKWQESNNEMESFSIGDDLENLIKRLNSEPNIGYPFQNGYYNQLFGGMRKSKYLVRSTITGGGKTRQALKDFCNVAFSQYYNWRLDKWISTGKAVPALFISTELNKDEIQTIALSYVTGINSKTINFGRFTEKQKQLLAKALKVMKDTPFYFEYIEDFNTQDITDKIGEYVKLGVEYVNFDYIQPTPRLMQQFKSSYGSNLREDQALVYLSKELKNLAEKYNIFMMSSTQVNAAFSDDDKSKSRTEYALRGGKSIADKIDYGVITSRFTKVDKRAFSKVGGLKEHEPNYSHHIYKNRNGEKDVIIWTHFNPGTLRETPLVVTDYNYNKITDIKPLEINYEEQG